MTRCDVIGIQITGKGIREEVRKRKGTKMNEEIREGGGRKEGKKQESREYLTRFSCFCF